MVVGLVWVNLGRCCHGSFSMVGLVLWVNLGPKLISAGPKTEAKRVGSKIDGLQGVFF